MVQIKALNKMQLEQFINSDEFNTMPVLPISEIRARSQIKNPRAQDSDSLLLLAYDGDKLLGYLGLLPDHLQLNGHTYRFAWFSTLWVDPNTRGQGLAKQLLNKAADDWDGQLAVTEFTAEAKQLYLKSGLFKDFPSLSGIRTYLRFELNDLLGHRVKFPFPLAVLDVVGNLITAPALSAARRKFQMYGERIQNIQDDQALFIREHQSDELFTRSPEDLNWILKWPWLRNLPEPDDPKYHFTASDKNAETFALQFKGDDGSIGGLVIALIRGQHLKLKFAYYKPEMVKKITSSLLNLMFQHNLGTLTVFDAGIRDHLHKTRMPFWLKKKYTRKYVMSEKLIKLSDNWDQYHVHAGDGDAAFT